MIQPHMVHSKGLCALLVKVFLACCIGLALLYRPYTAVNFAKGAKAWVSSCKIHGTSIGGLSTGTRLNKNTLAWRKETALSEAIPSFGEGAASEVTAPQNSTAMGRVLQGSQRVLSLDQSECPQAFERLAVADIASKAVAPYIFGGEQQPSCNRCKLSDAESYYAGLCKFHRTSFPRDR